MLQANEVRIGNLLLIDGQIAKLIALQPHDHLTRCDTEEGCDFVFYSVEGEFLAGNREFGPIPLTDEWLLKFGFKTIEDVFLVEIGDINRALLMRYIADYWSPVIEQSPELSGGGIQVVTLNCIQYVHQLQNLYFALTGQELIIQDGNKP